MIIAQDLYDYFGETNVTQWATIDGNNPEARIAAAIQHAEDMVNARLEGGPYVIPLSPVDYIIKHVCVVLAGDWLYNARGANNEDDQINQRLKTERDRAYFTLSMILAGSIQLKSARKDSVPTGPCVI